MTAPSPAPPNATSASPDPPFDRAAVHAAVEAYHRVAATTRDFAPHAHAAFELLETLGEGGMGKVLRMRDRRLGRQVAVKLIRDGGGVHQALRVQRFRREALLTSSLEHPAIPPVYEAGTTPDGQPYLAMRLIEGPLLSALIRDHHAGGLDAPTRRAMLETLLKVGEAVAYAHGEQVVHRDLKPDNVIVGRYGEVMLMDWGLAKRLSELESTVGDSRDITRHGAFLGTMGYVSPEQAQGRTDPRADVFSLGAMLTEILTQALPVGGGTEGLASLMSGVIANPASLRKDVPPELDAIARWALAAEVDARTQTAETFVEQLRAYLAGEDVPGYPYGPVERAARSLRSHPMLVVSCLAALLVVAVAAVAGVVVTESRRARLAAEGNELAAQQQAALVAVREREAQRTRAQIESALELLAAAEPLLQRGQLEQGLARVDEALGESPPRFLLWHAARVCQAGAAYDRAKALLERLIATYPPALDALYQLHRVEAAEQGLAVGTETPALRRLRAQADLEGENAFRLLNSAMVANDDGRHQEAIELASRALELYPGLGQAANVRGFAYHQLGERVRAVEDFRLAVTLEPTVTIAWSNLALLLSETGQNMEALAAVDQALQIRPTVQGHNVRGNVLQNLGRHEEALFAYAAGLELDPRAARLYLNRGNAKRQLQRWEDALKDYEAMLRLNGDDVAGHLLCGLTLLTLERFDEAERRFSEVLLRAPRQPSAHAGMGFVHHHRGEPSAALAAFERALTLDPDHMDARSWRTMRAELRKQLGR